MLSTLNTWVFLLSGIPPVTEKTHVPHLPGSRTLA